MILIQREVLVIGLTKYYWTISVKWIDLVARKSDFVACECPLLTVFFQTVSPLTKYRPNLGPNNYLQLLKYLMNPCHYGLIYIYSSFVRKRGKSLLIHHNILSDWSSISDMSLNSFLCTPFVELLTFAILWIGLLIIPERVEICSIKSYIIKSSLNVATLYFEDPGIVFDQRLKGFRAVFTSAQDRKLSSLTCYRKYDIVYYLLHSRPWPVTFEKKSEVFSFHTHLLFFK